MFTPPRRRLTSKTTLGFEVIRFAREVLDIELLPWQEWLLKHALELNPDGEFRFRTVVMLVARQNGKSLLMQVLTLWRMYVDRCRLAIGTAQDLEVAESLWDETATMAEDMPQLAAEIDYVHRGSGRKTIKLTSGSQYKVKAATRRGGRGLSGELVLLDELREHQSWDAWAAVSKTTNAMPRAQVWGISNAGDTTSVVLRHLRAMAHMAVGNPDGLDEPSRSVDGDLDDLDDGDSLGIFEWSAEPGCRITDRDAWQQANPSLGYLIRESTLAAEARTDPEWIYRTEVLCQWQERSRTSPFPAGTWEDTTDADSAPVETSPVRLCVDVSWDRSYAYIAVAAWRGDGLAHVEIVAAEPGTDWVVGWFTSPRRDASLRGVPVVLQTNGSPASTLIDPLTDAGIEVTNWMGPDLGRATGALYDRVTTRTIRHRPQPVLDLAAGTAAMKPAGDAWLWDRRKSPNDVSPLIAATGALWALDRPAEPPAVSAYETRRLEVLA